MMDFDWLDKSEFPFSPHYFSVNGFNLHYIDEGEGDIILFVHGTPSWSFDSRKLIRELRKEYRCIAVDHIGFGLSDKPADYNYSTINHSHTLWNFIREKHLKKITLVVHDFGGPIGMNVAIEHPEFFKNIVIINSWLWSSVNDPDFLKLRKILKSPLLPFLYLYANFSPRFLLPRSFGDHKLPGNLLYHYTRPFANKSQRYGALAFARSLLNDQDWFEELWSKKEALGSKPMLLIWGMKDPVVKPSYLEKFILGFPHASVIKLETCGHFPQEEQAGGVVKALQEFLNKHQTIVWTNVSNSA
jgi:pimeloyl-ACP methyl ester carboxylesterase